MSLDGGPPQLLANGEACTEDARCTSGHCDNVCCDKGSECCTVVSDCTTQGGLGMACDDRSTCRGSAGAITCTSDFKCMTVNGARNDTACSNRIEANDCGLYPSVFCLGGERQQGAPACATSCATDNECDVDAHCNMGKCEADKPNGQPCTRAEDCAATFCKNIVNGTGICCGLVGDCCVTPDDCPDTYRRAATCTDREMCRGTETLAMCIANICSMMMVQADSACVGMPGPTCGLFQDVTCMAATRSNACRTSCTMMGHCDANAFCDGSQCQARKPNGEACASAMECTSDICNNGVCCGANQECCKTVADCKMKLDLRCDDPTLCRGSKSSVMCQQARCVYGDRIDDDSACTGPRNCGLYDDLDCNGEAMQSQSPCPTTCRSASDCDENAVCVIPDNGPGTCQLMGSMAGMNGNSGGGAAGGGANSGPGNGNSSNP